MVMLAKGNRSNQVREACQVREAWPEARGGLSRVHRRSGWRRTASERSKCWNFPNSAGRRSGAKGREAPTHRNEFWHDVGSDKDSTLSDRAADHSDLFKSHDIQNR